MTSNLTFINPSDAAWTRHRYVLAFGAYGSTVLCAHANSLENALDACVDWLEDNAPGMLCDDMVAEEYEAALRDGLTEDEAIERAEQDVTRAGNASRTAPTCTDPYDCSDPSDGIAMNYAAFRVTTTRQRAIRAAWYDGETDLVYLAFAKSVWCNSGVCLTQNVTSPGALMFLRFRLGAGDVFERKVADGDYHHIPAIRRGPDGRIYLYAESGGLAYEHVSDDEGAT